MIKANIILQAFPDNWFHMMVKDVSFNSFNKNFRNMSEPEWVLNFKKALVSLFKVQEDQNNLNKPGTEHTW